MQFKKFNGMAWETVRHKIYGNGTDSLTAFPAVIQASGESLTDYTIYGNTVQDGAPTPEAPVDVVGCGERTGNLFDKNATDITNGYVIDCFLFITGDTSYYQSWRISEYIPASSNVNYYLKWDIRESVAASAPSICFYRSDKSYIGGINYKSYTGFTFTTPKNTAYIRFSFIQSKVDYIMLNAGSTPLPYEPYGYKIPVTSGGVTTNLYLDAPLYTGDTLTYTDTGIALPTSDGDNTISFGTTVQPSAMSATFNGWHPVQDAKQYDGSEWR